MNSKEETKLELDNADFVVGLEDYEEFSEALDEPPKSIPEIRELFLEEQRQKRDR
jgi:uncharacterized protein (DUF1778 family)